MKRPIFVFIILLFAVRVSAEEIYIYKDKNGITTITNASPPPSAAVSHRAVYQRSSSREIQQFEAQRRRIALEEEQRSESGRRISTAIERKRQQQQSLRQQDDEKVQRLNKSAEIENERLDKARRTSSNSHNPTFNSRWNSAIEMRKKELDNDPGQYFANKQNRDSQSRLNAINDTSKNNQPVAAQPQQNHQPSTYLYKTPGGAVDPKTGVFTPTY